LAESAEMNRFRNILEETSSYAPGAIGLISNRRKTYCAAVGFSDRQTKAPMNKTALLRIGSITKTYVAALAMMAVEDGLLHLETAVADYLDPSVIARLPQNLNPTVRQLLNHTSGIPDYNGIRFYLWDWRDKGPLKTDFILHAIRGKKARNTPGEKFNYSNTNYHLIALILEKLHGKTLAELFQTRIFSPLALHETFYGINAHPRDDIHGYGSPGRPWKDTYTWQENSGPDGGIFVTAADLNTWLHALFSAEGHYVKYARQMLADPVYEAERKQQGMGVEILISRSGDKVWGHTGGLDGYLTAAFYVPIKDTVMVLHVNRSKARQFGQSIAALLGYVIQSEAFE
jgi:D-alanyl-D-alanine carboxypeptidase